MNEKGEHPSKHETGRENHSKKEREECVCGEGSRAIQ